MHQHIICMRHRIDHYPGVVRRKSSPLIGNVQRYYILRGGRGRVEGGACCGSISKLTGILQEWHRETLGLFPGHEKGGIAHQRRHTCKGQALEAKLVSVELPERIMKTQRSVLMSLTSEYHMQASASSSHIHTERSARQITQHIPGDKY